MKVCKFKMRQISMGIVKYVSKTPNKQTKKPNKPLYTIESNVWAKRPNDETANADFLS